MVCADHPALRQH